jgi:GNAT superfamily N-acetyltransferase
MTRLDPGRLWAVNDLARFFAFERRLLERLSTRIEPFEQGTAFLDEEFRNRYDSNFLLVERPLEGVVARAILHEADRILGGASYPHREVVVRDDHHGERLASAFVEHRYTVARNLIMVHRRAPDRDPDLVTEELTFAEIRPLLHEINRRQPWATSDEIVRLLTDQHGKSERVIGARFSPFDSRGHSPEAASSTWMASTLRSRTSTRSRSSGAGGGSISGASGRGGRS